MSITSQSKSIARNVDVEREPRSTWAWEVRVNGRTYARCRSEDDAREVAHALRIAGDAESDHNRLARVQSELRALSEL